MAKDKQVLTITIPQIEPDAVGYEKTLMEQGVVNLNEAGQLHMNVKLGPKDSYSFLRLRAYLRATRATLRDEKPVHNNNDVLRWLCQQVASQSA